MKDFKKNIINKFIEMEDILLSTDTKDLQTLSEIAYIIESNKHIVLELLSAEEINIDYRKEVSAYYNDLKSALNI